MLLGVSAAIIILLLLMICFHAHFIRRIEAFGVNAGYYLSGDGGWAGQMQPAAASVDGSTGLVPTPKAGEQNSYLRGDGKWIQANNAPTAAQYIMVTQPIATPAKYNTLFAFSTTPMTIAGTAIKQVSPTQFQLAAGYSYKLVSNLGTGSGEVMYQWSTNGTMSGVIGIVGDATSSVSQNGQAIAYLSTTAIVIVGLLIVYANGTSAGSSVSVNGLFDGRQSWALLEVVSNNNTISAFTGSSSAGDGFIGYIPAPKAGQQNYVLTGSGGWRPSLMGSILQSVNVHRSGHRPGTTWTPVPILSVSVTPISTDSQFLLTANITFSQSGSGPTTTVFRFMRNNLPVGLGNADPNQYVGSFRASPSYDAYKSWTAKATGDYLDAPATTSNITYTLQFMTYDADRLVYFNGLDSTGNSVDHAICISTLTVQQC